MVALDLTKKIHVENKIIYGPKITPLKVKGLGSTLFEKLHEKADVVGQIDAITGEKDTFGQLLKRCVRTAIKMRSKGVKPKDVIVTCNFNNLNSFDPIVAALFLGAVTASLDPTISLTDTVHLLKQVSPKMVFVGPEAVELIEDAIAESQINAEIVVFGQSKKHSEFYEFLTESEEEESFLPVKVEDVKETAMIFFSSGTTGLPKGICLNHFSLLGLRDAQMVPNPIYDLVVVNFASTYWISTTTTFLLSIYFRHIRIVYPKYDVTKIWTLVKKYEINVLFLPPTHMLALCERGAPQEEDISKLGFLIVGGSAVSKEQMCKIEHVIGKPVVNGYALTEFSGAGLDLLFPSEDPEIKMQCLESIGKPLPGFAYKVVDPETDEVLGPNQNGELRINTEFQMNGYYNLDSSKEWDSEGFLKTGDIVYYDEEYRFFYVDRCKEMLKYQSWHVAPAKLENVLLSHPAVASAVVVGVPHPIDGDHPMGIITLKKSEEEHTTAEQIRSYVEERVDDRQKLRGGVKIITNIPLTPTGKINRRHVKNFILKEQECSRNA